MASGDPVTHRRLGDFDIGKKVTKDSLNGSGYHFIGYFRVHNSADDQDATPDYQPHRKRGSHSTKAIHKLSPRGCDKQRYFFAKKLDDNNISLILCTRKCVGVWFSGRTFKFRVRDNLELRQNDARPKIGINEDDKVKDDQDVTTHAKWLTLGCTRNFFATNKSYEDAVSNKDVPIQISVDRTLRKMTIETAEYLKKYFEFLYTCEDMKALKWSKFKTQEQQNAKQQQNGKQKDPTMIEMTVIGAAPTASATTASELKPALMSRTSSRASEHNSLTSSSESQAETPSGMIDVGYGLRAHHGSVSGKGK